MSASLFALAIVLFVSIYVIIRNALITWYIRLTKADGNGQYKKYWRQHGICHSMQLIDGVFIWVASAFFVLIIVIFKRFHSLFILLF